MKGKLNIKLKPNSDNTITVDNPVISLFAEYKRFYTDSTVRAEANR